MRASVARMRAADSTLTHTLVTAAADICAMCQVG